MCAKFGRLRSDKRQKQRRIAFADDIYYRPVGVFPVKEGEVIRVKVTETSVDNVGIARIGLFKISIPNSKIGEEVRILVRKVTNGGAVAEKLE